MESRASLTPAHFDDPTISGFWPRQHCDTPTPSECSRTSLLHYHTHQAPCGSVAIVENACGNPGDLSVSILKACLDVCGKLEIKFMITQMASSGHIAYELDDQIS